LSKTNLCQNLTASRFKLFWGTPLAPAPIIEFVCPFSNSPTQPHHYSVTYMQVKNPSSPPPPKSNTRCLRNIPMWQVIKICNTSIHIYSYLFIFIHIYSYLFIYTSIHLFICTCVNFRRVLAINLQVYCIFGSTGLDLGSIFPPFSMFSTNLFP
jgi:hypothetical protein